MFEGEIAAIPGQFVARAMDFFAGTEPGGTGFGFSGAHRRAGSHGAGGSVRIVGIMGVYVHRRNGFGEFGVQEVIRKDLGMQANRPQCHFPEPRGNRGEGLDREMRIRALSTLCG